MRSFAVIIIIAILAIGSTACGAQAAQDESEWKVSSNPAAGPSSERQATPRPVNLATTRIAPLWVELSDGDHFMAVRANPYFDVREFALDVFIDGVQYCNTHTIYEDDGWREMSCASEDRLHGEVQRVSAQSPRGDLRCAKNNQSTASKTLFACGWR